MCLELTSDGRISPSVLNIHAVATVFINHHSKSFIEPAIASFTMQQ